MMWDAVSSSSYKHNAKLDECIMSIEVYYSRHGVVGGDDRSISDEKVSY